MLAESDPLSKLQQWLCPESTNVRITSKSSTNRSLTIIHDTPADTTLLSIPTKHTITTNSALQNPLIDQILSSHPPPSPTSSQSAALLLQILLLSSSHDYKPWFDVLPKQIHTATTVSSIAPLLNTPLYALTHKLRQELQALYEDWYIPITKTFPNDFPNTLRNKDKFLYAHGILESRAFLQNNQTAITPLIDFCNHSLRPNSTVTTTASGTILRSTTEIGAGEEITICYGRLSNEDLLLHWGFAVPGNPFDEILLQLEHPEDVAKMIILATCVNRVEFCLRVDEPLPVALVKFVRILALGEEELAGGVRRDYSVAVGGKCEKGALRILGEIVDGLGIEKYGKEGDDGDGEEEFKKFCGIYRMGLVKILDLARGKIDEMEKALDSAE